MMAAKGAFYPVFELMRDQGETFTPKAYLPAITGYYTDVSGNMLSFPSTRRPPCSTTTGTRSARPGSTPSSRRKRGRRWSRWGRKLRARRRPLRFTTHWPSWILVENFSAFHNCRSRRARTVRRAGGGADARQPGHGAARRQARRMAGEPDFRLRRAGNPRRSQVPRRRMRHFLGTRLRARTIPPRPNSTSDSGCCPIGRSGRSSAELHHRRRHPVGSCKGRPPAEYAGVAKFLAFLSRPGVQARWHQAPATCRSRARPTISPARKGSTIATGGRHLDRADHAASAHGEFEGLADRLVRSRARRHRGRARAELCRAQVGAKTAMSPWSTGETR